MAIVGLDGFKATLNAKLLATDLLLPISNVDKSRIETLLGLIGYSYLVVANHNATEIIKVRMVNGEPIIERGKGGTTPLTVPQGGCVFFQITTLFLTEFLANSAANPSICAIIAGDGITVTPDAQQPCKITISAKEVTPLEWRVGNTIFKMDKWGAITQSAATTGLLNDGTYENAKVVIKDGVISSIQSGTNIVFTGGGLCVNCGNNGCATCPETL